LLACLFVQERKRENVWFLKTLFFQKKMKQCDSESHGSHGEEKRKEGRKEKEKGSDYSMSHTLTNFSC
jgi:hypothetical protein